jgi:hypothetical protein
MLLCMCVCAARYALPDFQRDEEGRIRLPGAPSAYFPRCGGSAAGLLPSVQLSRQHDAHPCTWRGTQSGTVWSSLTGHQDTEMLIGVVCQCPHMSLASKMLDSGRGQAIKLMCMACNLPCEVVSHHVMLLSPAGCLRSVC